MMGRALPFLCSGHHQRSIHALPISIELLLVYNFTANEDDISRHAGTSLIKHPWNEQAQSVWTQS
jgi:hypothetical protein